MFLAKLIVFLATACHPVKNVCETPIGADSIADSVGVNIHLNYRDTSYGNFPLVQKLLTQLGVRHTRDGIVDTKWDEYYQRHVALGRAGIKCLFITSPKQSDSLISSWPGRVPGAFEGYEAPNEYDLSGDPNWSASIRDFVPRLSRIAKSNPANPAFPLVGPSLTQVDSYGMVAGLQLHFDFSNMHNYFGGRNPGTLGWGAGGYGSITYNTDKVQTAWPRKPILTTETGYATDTSVNQGIPESVAGKYVPRIILEQKLHGISRTYIYELLDEGSAVAGTSGAFGLVRKDGTAKPAYTALKNLIAIVTDPGSAFYPENLAFTLLGSPGSLHHLLCSKRDGSYYLAFWLEEEAYDVNRRAETTVRPEPFTFATSRVFLSMELFTFDPEGNVKTTKLAADKPVRLLATDTVSLLRLK